MDGGQDRMVRNEMERNGTKADKDKGATHIRTTCQLATACRQMARRKRRASLSKGK